MRYSRDNTDQIERWGLYFAMTIGVLAPTILLYLVSLKG